MKKLSLIISVLLISIMLVGCGRSENNSSNNNTQSNKKSGTLVCTQTEEDTVSTITIKHKNNMVSQVKSEAVITVEAEYLDMSLGIMQGMMESFNSIKGISYKIEQSGSNTIKQTMEIDYNKLDINALNEIIASFGIIVRNLFKINETPKIKYFK